MNNAQTLEVIPFNVTTAPELQGLEEEQQQLVAKNPFIEITDATTRKQAKANRTALKGGRTAIKNQAELLRAKVLNRKRELYGEIDDRELLLISITQEAENKQQAEIDRDKLEQDERKRVEAENEKIRINKISSIITEKINYYQDLLLSCTLDNIDPTIESINAEIDAINPEEQFEEFAVSWNNKIAIVKGQFSVKRDELKLAKERAEFEAEQKRIADEQAAKLAAENAAFEATRLEIKAKAAAEQAEIERQNKIKADELAAQQKEQERIAAENAAEAQRLAAEEAERLQVEQQRIAAEEAAAAEKAEQERQAALAPDKHKLLKLFKSYEKHDGFGVQLQSEEANTMLVSFVNQINSVSINFQNKINEL